MDTTAKRVVSRAGAVLLVATAGKVGLDRALSAALAPWRKRGAVLDPGKILLDLAVSVAIGGDCLADVSLLRAEPAVFGRVASDPTVSRLVDALAATPEAALSAINTARAVVRATVWKLAGNDAPDHQISAEHPLVIDLDATLITAHSDKESAAPTYKRGFGFHPLGSWVDRGPDGTGEPLSMLLRPGNAGSNTSADHIQVTKDALRQLPFHRGGRIGKKVLIRTDGGGGTHEYLKWLSGQGLSYSVGFTLTDEMVARIDQLPEAAWTPAYDADRKVRDGAWVAELTGTFELKTWPPGMRVLIRAERPHPGAQLRFTDVDGNRLTAFVTNATGGQLGDLELRHRRRARCEDRIRGAPERLAALAADLVAHWEIRREQVGKFIDAPGKAMIVGGTREICANLYSQIIKLRPDWHSDDLDKGLIKVVYSSSASDQGVVTAHRRRDSDNKVIKERLRQVDDELQIVIIKDMMLTGYDSPPLHTLYLDRPLKGALLMQTLARVNRTFRGKEDGLLVAYAPLADNLQKALAEYTAQDQEAKPVGRNVDEAVAIATELLDSIRTVLAGYDWKAVINSGGKRRFLDAAYGAVNYLRSPATAGKQVSEGEETLAEQFRRESGRLARAWALCAGSGALDSVRPEVQFYEEVRVWMAKCDANERIERGEPIPEDIERLLANLIATSTASGDVLDIYEAAGMPKPTLSDLSPEFVAKAQQARNQHLAIEALRKMIAQETVKTTRNNVIRARAFSDRVSELMTKYTNQQLTSAEVIAALVEFAKEVAAEASRGAKFTPPLDDDQLAYYDAVAQNESAIQEQGAGVLADIARELVAVMRRDVRTDWTVRDDVRAKLRSSIKRLLVKHGYPPDKQPGAIKLVMEQMESMAPRFVEHSSVQG